jgi:hypothetical protein
MQFNIRAMQFDNEKMRPCSDAMSWCKRAKPFNIRAMQFNNEKMRPWKHKRDCVNR